MQKLYAGVRVAEGDAPVSPGYSPGGEAELSPMGGGVRSYQFGEAPGQSLGVLFATGFFGGFVHEDPAWDFRSFDLQRDLALAREKVGFLDATDPQALGAFAKRGGKLLQYHGWFDGSIPPRASVDFYDRAPAMSTISIASSWRRACCTAASGPGPMPSARWARRRRRTPTTT